ncbi:hypothetical protein TNCV_3029531 [Trichonephila clavipes]|nr:hypothetical protein TNCV_3029531 [Trichonephila clavipes]
MTDLIKKSPTTKRGEDGPQSTKRSIEAERRRGEGKNAGRKAGRPKAVSEPRTQSKRRSAVQLNHIVKSVKRVLFVELWGAERVLHFVEEYEYLILGCGYVNSVCALIIGLS